MTSTGLRRPCILVSVTKGSEQRPAREGEPCVARGRGTGRAGGVLRRGPCALRAPPEGGRAGPVGAGAARSARGDPPPSEAKRRDSQARVSESPRRAHSAGGRRRRRCGQGPAERATGRAEQRAAGWGRAAVAAFCAGRSGNSRPFTLGRGAGPRCAPSLPRPRGRFRRCSVVAADTLDPRRSRGQLAGRVAAPRVTARSCRTARVAWHGQGHVVCSRSHGVAWAVEWKLLPALPSPCGYVRPGWGHSEVTPARPGRLLGLNGPWPPELPDSLAGPGPWPPQLGKTHSPTCSGGQEGPGGLWPRSRVDSIRIQPLRMSFSGRQEPYTSEHRVIKGNYSTPRPDWRIWTLSFLENGSFFEQ